MRAIMVPMELEACPMERRQVNSVQLLQEAIDLAKGAGYRLREERLDCGAGDVCEVRGERWIFLDVEATPQEQLEIVLEALRMKKEQLTTDSQKKTATGDESHRGGV